MAEASDRQWPTVAALGTAQTLAWASSYYLVAILADPMARDLGTSPSMIYGAFSAALLVSALLGPRVGRSIDRFGGREVLAVSSLLFMAGLMLLGLAPNLPAMWAGWLIVGAAMGLGLYDAAFAALGRVYGTGARSAITGITLIAGFASTIGWPLTSWGEAEFGWRSTCLAWATTHLILGLPLNLAGVPPLGGKAASAVTDVSAHPQVPMDRAMWLLGFAFAAGWIVSTGMAAHLPRVLEAAGATSTQAIVAAALIGPAQVAARLAEAGLMRRFHPLVSARLSTLAHPIGVAVLLAGGGWLAAPFALLHGAGNGVLTIARGTVPLAVFGPKDYGYRLGLLGAPARIGQAGAPLGFGLLIEGYGSNVLIVTAVLCLLAFCALLSVRSRDEGLTLQ